MEKYINDKKGFRKLIRSCKTIEELANLFDEIGKVKLENGNTLTFYIKNRYEIQVVDMWLSEKYGINVYFDGSGFRSFKNIKKFSYEVQLVEAYNWNGFSFSVGS